MDGKNEVCLKVDEEHNRLERMFEILLQTDLKLLQKLLETRK